MSQQVRSAAYPELTIPAVVVGYFLGILIAISIGYASLMLGFSIEGSELAAILGFGILRGLMRRRSIVENNINQTIASSVNGASAGMMFSVPALFILGYEQFNPYVLVFACISGGILGIAFIIPLRKQMIDFERLTYPGGVAVANILKSPGAGIRKAVYLLGGAVLSAVVHIVVHLYSWENVDVGAAIGLPTYMNTVFYVSLLTAGAAYIAGKGGIHFVVGGFVCYWVLAPVLSGLNLLSAAAEGTSVVSYMRLSLFRPVGIGMLIGGALTGLVFALPLISSAIRTMQSNAKMKSQASQEELPIYLMYIAVAGAALLLFFMAVTSAEEIGWLRAGVMAVLGTLWVWIAGVILSECIGRTNWSPLSGMTLIAITILIVIARSAGDAAAITASVFVGAAACVAMSQATDLMMDLKTGYLVGASPRKQQIGQYLGTWLGPIVIMALIFLLHKAYTLGSDKLPAPQGQALASMIQGILGGNVPIEKYAAGAGLGALLSATGISGLGVLVGLGFYMPFNVVLSYAVGTAARMATDKKFGTEWSEEIGIPAATGLIVGEALVGVGFALYFVFTG